METPALTNASTTPSDDQSQSPKDDPLLTPAAEVKPPAQLQKLSYLLNQSNIYSKIIGEKMARERTDRIAKEAKTQKQQASGKVAPVVTNAKKRKAAERIADVIDEEDLVQGKNSKLATATEKVSLQARQPALVTGATLKDYQLDGVEWMVSLFTNGLSGILADEMGLGKTIQTIALLAHLREKGVWGPFLVVCPLSTVANWVSEFERFTPDIPVVLYHGTPTERAELRHKRLGMLPPGKKKGSKSKKKAKVEDEDVESHNEPEKTFPVIVTSYEMVMNDKKFLQKIDFKYIVVDESHRLKNLNCKLVRELKQYQSANRLLLTGTPLHNNLTELWSLLNFILPDIFDDLDSFSQWFDFSDIDEDAGHAAILSKEQSHHIVSNLHAILKPFLLRRLKKDVETDLPPKKEYLLSAPLTAQQKELYDAVINRSIRSFLMEKKMKGDSDDEDDAPLASTSAPIEASGRKRRRTGKVSYAEKTNEEYFDNLDAGVEDARTGDLSIAERSKLHQMKVASKSVNTMKLQNMVMQLRKVCNHPWLFDWPIDPRTGIEAVNEDLINASGKMLMLNKLLLELFAKGHKVLLFSQFVMRTVTSMLDIIQDWATELKKWNICRIDGSTKQTDRRDQMREFQEQGPDAPNLFLLSTRAGGVGITLTSADTVILFDSDWNPQQDLQAQDRAHRIGQTKPVLVFRFITGNTIESHILKKAGAKRKLEALVIGQGEFKLGGDDVAEVLMGKGKKGKSEFNMADLAQTLLRREEEVVLAGKDDEIISKDQLASLLDRSPEAMLRNTGWQSGDAIAEVFDTAAAAEQGQEEDDLE